MSCISYQHQNQYGGSMYVSGTTCNGVVGAYTLNYLDEICMDNDFPIQCCEGLTIVDECVNPTPTPTQTITATFTPTPTQTATNTPTPTITQSPFAVCPEELIFDSQYSYLGLNGTYTRLRSYTGGTFEYGYQADNFTSGGVFYGNQLTSGNAYSVFGRQSGSTYYQLGWRTVISPNRWKIWVSTGDYVMNGGLFVSGLAITISSILVNGILFPEQGQGTSASYISYPSICPTPTPTLTPTTTTTPTKTSTNTPTPSITASPTNTQTPTATVGSTATPTPTITDTPTQTPTPTITDTPTSTPAITPTQTQTQTNTPSSTPVCACYYFFNEDSVSSVIFYTSCGGSSTSETLSAGQSVERCIDPVAETPSYTGGVTTIGPCSSATACTNDSDCTNCT